MPVAGRACVLFRYFHSMKLDELLENNATQSPASPGPFVTVAVTEPPGAMFVESTTIELPLETVTTALLAMSVEPV